MVDLFIEGQVLTEMDKGEESLEKEGWDILTKVLEWVISKFEITGIRFQSYWKNFLNEESLRYSRPGYCILKEFWNQSGKKKLERTMFVMNILLVEISQWLALKVQMQKFIYRHL